jgi:hypothetical protein
MKKIKTFDFGLKKTDVYFDEKYREYTVTFDTGSDGWFRDDYYTDDYADAVSVALYFCEN